MTGRTVASETAVAQLQENGFAVIEGAIRADELSAVRAEIEVALQRTPLGRNEFEGHRTKRVYALLASCPSTACIADHPDVLAAAAGVLLPGFLLSAHLAIALQPGETAQPLHYDDGFYVVPRPRPPLGLSAIWAIDDFTIENGATEVVPRSHHLGTQAPDPHLAEPVEMSAGSVLLMLGTTWHRGGANRTARPRLAVTSQYCEPWVRQQEQMVLSIPVERARSFSRRLRGLLGYSIHPPFMGHVAGMHPERLLRLDTNHQDDTARPTAAVFWGRPPSDTSARASVTP